MRNPTIAVSVLLLVSGAARAGESLARIRNALGASFRLVTAQPSPRGGGFPVTIKKIEGNKITFVRHDGRPDEKEETLIAADDCRLFERRLMRETKRYEMMPAEGGLKGDIDAKEFVTAEILTERDKIVEIRGDGPGRSVSPQRRQTFIKKIDGDKVEVFGSPVLDTTLTVKPDCKVWEVRFGGEGLPLVTTPVAGGVKSEAFKKGGPVLIVSDAKQNLLEICFLRPHPHVFEGPLTNIEGDKLTLVKRLTEGREETVSVAADCAIVEHQFDSGMWKAIKVPFEPGLKYEFLTMKDMRLRFHTDKEHKVTRIIVLKNPYLREAIVKMDRPDTVRIFTGTKETKGKKGTKGTKDVFLALSDECRILQGRVDRETATTTYALVKGGIKEAKVPTRPLRALIMQNDANKVIEMRIVKDPANFPAYISKVEKNEAGEWKLSTMEPTLTIPGSESRGTYHGDFMVSKDCKVFKRRSAGGRSTLEPVEGNDLLTLRPKDSVKGGPIHVVARILLGADGKVAEVQILEGVTKFEP